MTPIEEEAVRLVVQTVTREAMDDGILCAVEMIRIAALTRPSMPLCELADAIESTIGQHSK